MEFVYYDGGMSGNTYINSIYDEGDKVLMCYFSPQSIYCDDCVFGKIRISKQIYSQLDIVDNEITNSDVYDDIWNSNNTEFIMNIDSPRAIIEAIYNDNYCLSLVDEWYQSNDYLCESSDDLSDYIFNKLEYAVDNDIIDVSKDFHCEGIGDDLDILIEYLTDRNNFPHYSDMLFKIKPYL